jgi:uncharacterized protein YgiM (DUF1202 family)
MKTNCWLILGTMLATTAVAQVNTNKLPQIPPPAIATPAGPASAPAPAPAVTTTATKTHAPAKKAVKVHKKARKKAAVKVAEKKTPAAPVVPAGPVTLVPGPATVAADHLNLRGQAGLQGEVVGHVQKGDTVTVLAEINLDKPKAGEPAQWAKIALPSDTKVWLNSKYITNNEVSVAKLNLRGGPGENFSVLGVIEKGASVTPVTTKGDWTQIQTPASAFAFVAASYLKQEGGEPNAPVQPVVAAAETVPPTPPVVTPPPAVPVTPTTVPEAQPIAPPAATPPPAPESAAPTTPPPAAPEAVPAPVPEPVTPAMTMPTPTLAPEEEDTNNPPPPRIVTHEGSVRHSVSLVAPTYFELFDPSNDKAIDYLYTTSTNLNLARYDGLHIAVTGREGLDPRWKDTPVLTIEKIYVLSSDKALPPLKPVKSKSWF